MALNISDALSQNVVDKRIDVLQRIKQYGSISEAARSAGISYKPHGRQSKRFPLLPGNRWSKKPSAGTQAEALASQKRAKPCWKLLPL